MVDFKEIVDNVRLLKFESVRSDQDNFFEAVIANTESEKLKATLKNFLGEPVYPSNVKLSSQALEAIKGYGGIMAGQTLYFKSEGDNIIFAALWPWRDGVRTTVKIVKK